MDWVRFMAIELEELITQRVQELLSKLSREVPSLMRGGDSWTITINGKGIDVDIDWRTKEKLGMTAARRPGKLATHPGRNSR